MRLGIRQKMIFVLLSVLIFALGTTGWLTLKKQEQEVVSQTQQRGNDLIRFTSESLVYSVVGYDYHTIQLLLDEIVKGQDIDYAKVINAKGNVMAESGRLNEDAEPWTVFNRNIVFDSNSIGELTLALDNRRIIEHLQLKRDALIRQEVIIILLIAIGEFLALSYVIMRPVSVISRSMESNVDEHGLITTDIPLDSNDEFGRLARQFNEMRKKLNKTAEKLHSRINLADKELQDKNQRLLKQSEELQRVNKELKQLTVTDPLTKLFNRRHFDNILQKEFNFSQRHADDLSVVCLDIDHFKSINDKYGHAAGDKVLVEMANLIMNNARTSDCACRIGGEEFAIICRRTGKNEVEEFAEKIRHQLELHYIDIGEDVISVTASFGAMTCPNHHVDIKTHDELVNCADMAMYYSKEHGRNRTTHYTDLLNKIESMASNIVTIKDKRHE